jgi:hypothetical protein
MIKDYRKAGMQHFIYDGIKFKSAFEQKIKASQCAQKMTEKNTEKFKAACDLRRQKSFRQPTIN